MLFYCGIDIAKRTHEAWVIDAEGKPLLDSITIINTQEGCKKLFSLSERLLNYPTPDDMLTVSARKLTTYYQSLKARGKHHLTAVGAVAWKMCNIILTILRENRPYQATPPKKSNIQGIEDI